MPTRASPAAIAAQQNGRAFAGDGQDLAVEFEALEAIAGVEHIQQAAVVQPEQDASMGSAQRAAERQLGEVQAVTREIQAPVTRPRDLFSNAWPGGWQEDAHTDVIHNVVDALRAFPDWNDD